MWSFLDGTVCPICRVKDQQQTLYNGHKRFNAVKFQSVITPGGMLANLYGPVEGRRYDCALLAMSNFLQDWRQFFDGVNGQVLYLFGDPAYPMRRHLQSSFSSAHLNQQLRNFNQSMSQVRVTIEWVFGDVIIYLKHMDFRENLKIGLICVSKMYRVSAILTNAYTCLYKNNVSTIFGVGPPLLEDYIE